MKNLKNILAKIFAVWALIVFVSTMLLLYIPFLVTGLWKEPRRTLMFLNLSRLWMFLFFTLTGVRRKFVGRKNFRKGENYVVVCNHNTFMDVPLSSPGIPGANKTIAKSELTKVPLFGILYKRGSVLVNRKSEESRRTSFLKMKEVLATGMHMCLYPEGTRNKSNEPLQPFHSGAFRLAVETGKPIIPTLIFGTKDVMPLNKGFYFWPHRVEMHFLQPVLSSDENVDDLKQKVFEIMKNYYVDHSKKFYGNRFHS